jgi:predicted SprT family Zn-dependent metalloprotease
MDRNVPKTKLNRRVNDAYLHHLEKFLIDDARACIEKYRFNQNVNTWIKRFGEPKIVIDMSNRKCGLGGHISYRYARGSFIIRMYVPYLAHFGCDEFVKSYRHEVAHLVEWLWYRKFTHSHSFKEICSTLGGSMNSKLAGKEFAHCATSAFFSRRELFPRNVKYTCPTCGQICLRRWKYNLIQKTRKRCAICKTSLLKWQEEIINQGQQQ